MTPDLLKSDALRKSLQQDISTSNLDVTHAAFAAGVRSKKMGVKYLLVTPSSLLRGWRRMVFVFFVIGYAFAPFFLVPWWAWREQNWWLLFGVLVSAKLTQIGVAAVYKPKKQTIIATGLLLAVVLFWSVFGIHNYFTYYSICALWGLWMVMMAERVESNYALMSLVENESVFNLAKDRIMIVRRD